MHTEEEKLTGHNEEEDKNEIALRTDYSNDITELPPKMQRFIHLYVTGQYTLTKLAELLEVHPNTLGNWLRRKDVKDIIFDMQEVTKDMVSIQLKALTINAVSKLSDLMKSPIDGVALQAVKDVLDRAGHKPKQEIHIDKKIVTYEQKLTDLINNVIDITDFEVMEDDDNTSN